MARLLVKVRYLLVVAVLGCTGKTPERPEKGCKLAGQYRLRFDAGVGQWLWLRFRVDDRAQTATLTPPFAIDRASQLKLQTEPEACKLSLIATTKRGDLLAQATLDPKTNAVKGTLRRAGSRDSVPLDGVRDVGAPIVKDPCLKPGVFELVIPAEQTWKNDDGKSCDGAALRVRFMVEPFGDRISIDQLDATGDAEWAAEDVFQDGACEVEVRFRHDDWYTYSKFVFAGDTVTATTSSANIHFVTPKGDAYRCKIASPMAWVERVSALP